MTRTVLALGLAVAVVCGLVFAPLMGIGAASGGVEQNPTYDVTVGGLSISLGGELCAEEVADDVVKLSGEDLTFDDLEMTLAEGTPEETVVSADSVDVEDEIVIYAKKDPLLIDLLETLPFCLPFGWVPLEISMDVYYLESSDLTLDEMELEAAEVVD